MLSKVTLAGIALVAAPICFVSARQGPDTTPTPRAKLAVAAKPILIAEAAPTDAPRVALTAATSEIERLKAHLKAANERAQQATRRSKNLRKELNEALDMVVAATPQERRRSCTPSRSRALMTHYQWMHRRGYDKRAEVLFKRLVGNIHSNADQLNRLAWDLMTHKETAGKFDELALAVSKLMQKSRRLPHTYQDTAALAHFLNGHVETAITLQKAALKSRSSSDYRRRLRTYEAALAAHPKAKSDAKPVRSTALLAQKEEE